MATVTFNHRNTTTNPIPARMAKTVMATNRAGRFKAHCELAPLGLLRLTGTDALGGTQ